MRAQALALSLLLAGCGGSADILSPKEAQEKYRLPSLPECEEDGLTFAENALLKAKTCLSWSGLPSLGSPSLDRPEIP